MRFLNFTIFVFTSVITFFFLFLVTLWLYLDYEEMPSFVKKPKREYDFIIVGAGTAGSVVAHELVKNSNFTVLLIEAGEKFGVLSRIPLLSTALQGTYMDWAFKTVSQKYSSKGLQGQQQKCPRGKGLGGSSQINYMLHYGGVASDFDRWSKLGLFNWSFSAVKPFLPMPTEDESSIFDLKSREHNNICSATKTSPSDCTEEPSKPVLLRTGGRMIPINKLSTKHSPLCHAFIEAQPHLTTPVYFKLSEYNIFNGFRWSTYHSYLRPAFKNKNLFIMTKSIVTKILFENKKALGVQISRQYEPLIEIRAKREVIICGGAIQTPQLLKVSGVGPKEELNRLDIPLVHENPFVGEHLHDHLNLPLYVSINTSASVNLMKIVSFRELKNYLIYGTGVYSNMAIYGQGCALNEDIGILLFGIGSVDEQALREIANYKAEVFRAFFPLYKNISQEGFTILSTCLVPKSRGSVRLNGTSMKHPPLIDPNYLVDPSDVTCMIKAIKLAVDVVTSAPFQRLGAHIHWPRISECDEVDTSGAKYPSDEYLECIIRVGALTAHHPGGSCAMGVIGHGVVDEEFKVQGMSNLRIVDASVLPTPVAGTPNYLITVLGTRAAHFILHEGRLKEQINQINNN